MDEEWKQWKFAGIYGIRHIEDGKIYVGQSRNIANRVRQHRFPAKRTTCPYLYNALQKHGWDAFKIIVLDRVDDISKLTEHEQYWIDTLDACNPNKGYNVRRIANSNNGIRRTDEQKMKNRLAHLGKKQSPETIEKIKASNLERKASPEYRAQISNALKGRKPTEETMAKKHATMERLYHTDERTIIILNCIINNRRITLSEIARTNNMSPKTAIRIANRHGWYKENGYWKLTKNNSKVIDEYVDDRIDTVLSYIINNSTISYNKIACSTNISRNVVTRLIKQAGWIKENGYWKCINGDINAKSNENITSTDTRTPTNAGTGETADSGIRD